MERDIDETQRVPSEVKWMTTQVLSRSLLWAGILLYEWKTKKLFWECIIHLNWWCLWNNLWENSHFGENKTKLKYFDYIDVMVQNFQNNNRSMSQHKYIIWD